MPITRYVVKNPAFPANSTQIGGFTTNRYQSGAVGSHGYGVVPANSYLAGDTIVFAQIPSKKIISATFSSLDATPVVLSLTPSTDLTAAQTFTTTGNTVGFSYVIVYDDTFSGAKVDEIKLTLTK